MQVCATARYVFCVAATTARGVFCVAATEKHASGLPIFRATVTKEVTLRVTDTEPYSRERVAAYPGGTTCEFVDVFIDCLPELWVTYTRECNNPGLCSSPPEVDGMNVTYYADWAYTSSSKNIYRSDGAQIDPKLIQYGSFVNYTDSLKFAFLFWNTREGGCFSGRPTNDSKIPERLDWQLYRLTAYLTAYHDLQMKKMTSFGDGKSLKKSGGSILEEILEAVEYMSNNYFLNDDEHGEAWDHGSKRCMNTTAKSSCADT